MKNIIEVIKANKGAILKRGLIVLGTAAGLLIFGKFLIAKNATTECPVEEVDENVDEDEDEDSEEE